MKKSPDTSKKTLSLKFGEEGVMPTQLQEKLQRLKDLYTQTSPQKAPPPVKKKAETLPKPLSVEEEKKAKAIQHEKEQKVAQKQAKRQRFEKIQQALDWLCVQYPLCFDKENPKPLKRRLEKDILDTDVPEDLPFSRLNIRKALGYYVRGFKYREALSKATHRYNLQAEVVEEVLSEHQVLAQVQLTDYIERKKKFYAEKKEKQKAWKERMKKEKEVIGEAEESLPSPDRSPNI